MQYSTFHTLHIGATHVRHGLPCQDMCLSSGDERFQIAVVSDGHGNRRHFRSERGSKAACEVALVRIREFLEKTADWPDDAREAQVPDLKQVICRDWRAAILEDARVNPWNPEEIEEQRTLLSETVFEQFMNGETAAYAYGCTLCAVFTAEWGWGAVQVGDGCVAVIDADGTYRWPMPESLLNVGHRTASLCSNNPMEDFRHVMEYNHPAGLAVYSDGIEKTFPNESKEIIGMLHWVWKNQRFGEEGCLDKLTKLLGEITQRSRIGDDVSIAGIIDMDAEDVAPKISQSHRMQELKALEMQREELFSTVEYNRGRLRDILRESSGSDAEAQLRRILDRREADLAAIDAAINAKREQLGLAPIEPPKEEPEIPADDPVDPEIPSDMEITPCDTEETQDLNDEPDDNYFWGDEDESGSEPTDAQEMSDGASKRHWIQDDFQQEVRDRGAGKKEPANRRWTPDDYQQVVRGRGAGKREPADRHWIQDDFRQEMNDRTPDRSEQEMLRRAHEIREAREREMRRDQGRRRNDPWADLSDMIDMMDKKMRDFFNPYRKR